MVRRDAKRNVERSAQIVKAAMAALSADGDAAKAVDQQIIDAIGIKKF